MGMEAISSKADLRLSLFDRIRFRLFNRPTVILLICSSFPLYTGHRERARLFRPWSVLLLDRRRTAGMLAFRRICLRLRKYVEHRSQVVILYALFPLGSLQDFDRAVKYLDHVVVVFLFISQGSLG
jgi:hypothetical protein